MFVLVNIFPSFEVAIDFCGILTIVSLAGYLILRWVREPLAAGTPGGRRDFRLRATLVSALLVSALAIIVWGEVSVRHMEIYSVALRSVNSSQTSKQVLGDQIVAGWWTNCDIHLVGDNGRTYLGIPVSGNRGKGYLHVNAIKTHGTWSITEMYVLKHGSTEKIAVNIDAAAIGSNASLCAEDVVVDELVAEFAGGVLLVEGGFEVVDFFVAAG
jgi:hypothetical protein